MSLSQVTQFDLQDSIIVVVVDNISTLFPRLLIIMQNRLHVLKIVLFFFFFTRSGTLLIPASQTESLRNVFASVAAKVFVNIC